MFEVDTYINRMQQIKNKSAHIQQYFQILSYTFNIGQIHYKKNNYYTFRSS